MTLPLISGPVLAAFLVASLVLAATPGPGVLYIVTRTLAQGRRAGLASVAGVAAGNLGNALAASLGLAALLAVSTLAFSVVKFAGAAYLVWLGIKALRAPPLAAASAPGAAPPPLRRILRDGFVVALLNPKTALFFAAFLPQFIDPAASAVRQSVTFGAAFVLIAACTDSAYALAAGLVAPRLSQLRGVGALGRYATAAVYFGLGVYAATSGSRSAK
jgi:threonine/homoserine/homoserine lactone efflux protein